MDEHKTVEQVVRGRRLTPAEVGRYHQIREQVENEWPEIEERIRCRLKGDALHPIAEELKQARLEKGLSLTDLSRISGVAPETLSRLESGIGSTDSIQSLEQHAGALGKRLVISLADEATTAG